MKITKQMKIVDVLQQNKKSAKILMENGLMCVGCPFAMQETLEQGCLAHGIDVDKILEKINKDKKPKKK